ncbi:MAG TPA: hypothetical protein VFV66_16085 [Nonomuraea sp.]|nr:hypothetical protein [Nonomuraea sp.]
MGAIDDPGFAPHQTIGRHAHPKAKPEQPAAAASERGTGIDYLRLLDDQQTATLATRINYTALTSKNTDRQGEDEQSASTLTTHEMDSSSPFACLLIGQPTLRRKIKLGVLAALDQRIAVRYHMNGMAGQETLDYLPHPPRPGRSDRPAVHRGPRRADPYRQPRRSPRHQQPGHPSPAGHLHRRQDHRRRIGRPRRGRRIHQCRVIHGGTGCSAALQAGCVPRATIGWKRSGLCWRTWSPIGPCSHRGSTTPRGMLILCSPDAGSMGSRARWANNQLGAW